MQKFLGLDEQTARDLEIFQSASGGQTLYDYCNLTQTEGGAKVLRRRMAQPWCSAAEISGTQAAIKFINAHHNHFAQLQRLSFSANRVEHYLAEILPGAVHDNSLEFGLEVISIRMNHQSHYMSISRGVQFCTRLIASLAGFIKSTEIPDTDGDLGTLLTEMSQLLQREKFADIEPLDAGDWPWRVLRCDQTFRFHEKDTVVRLLEILYEIDALIAMAEVSGRKNMVIPEILEGAVHVEAEGLAHPFLTNPVRNPVYLDDATRVLFLTGPNMAGKTTYLRSFATALYLAHLGMSVPAESFQFVPMQHLFSSISLSDNLQDGVSYFRAEALRVRTVAEAIAAGDAVVAVMDEPFKGTNVKDAYDASLAILERFAEKTGCLFMFSSHLIELNDQLTSRKHIDCRHFDARESGERLEFDYTIRPGISDQRLGMRVLEEEGIFELLGAN